MQAGFISALRHFFTRAAVLAAGVAVATPMAAGNDRPAKTTALAPPSAPEVPLFDRTILLDPQNFDLRVGGGIAPADAVAQMLRENGYTDFEPTLPATLARHMLKPDHAATGERVLAVDPYAYADYEGRACIIVAATDNALPSAAMPFLAALPMDKVVALFNAHEKAHCLASMQYHVMFAPLETDMTWSTLQDRVWMPDFIGGQVRLYRAEVMADVVALGEAVRTQEEYDTTDIRAWARARAVLMLRSPSIEKARHGSPPALLELERRIAAMGGVAAFRAMDESAAMDMYRDITLHQGLGTPQAMQAFFIMQDGGAEDREDVIALSRPDAGTRNGVLMWLDLVIGKHAIFNDPGTEKIEAAVQQVIYTMSRNWDARAELQARAEAMDGGTTPQNRAESYARMLDALQRGRTGASESLYRIKAQKLRTAFIEAGLPPPAALSPIAPDFSPGPVLELGRDGRGPAMSL